MQVREEYKREETQDKSLQKVTHPHNNIYDNQQIKYSKNKKISVPGQSKFHYSPGIPIRLNANNRFLDEALILIKKRKDFDRNYFYLTKNRNLKEAGKKLYKTLRRIKNLKYKKIAIEKIPNIGIGQTINDRLKRASKR